MSGSFMRKLMESVGQITQVENIVNQIQQEIDELENNAKEYAQQRIEKARRQAHLYGNLANLTDEELYKWALINVKNIIYEKRASLKNWQQVAEVAEPLPNVVPINPMNPRATAHLGGVSQGIVRSGYSGEPTQVLNWLQTNMRQKANAVQRNIQKIEKLAPEPITWKEAYVELKPIFQGRGHWNASRPGAHVLFIGETESGGDVRFFFQQGTTPEGGSRQAIVNGRVYKSGMFEQFVNEFQSSNTAP